MKVKLSVAHLRRRFSCVFKNRKKSLANSRLLCSPVMSALDNNEIGTTVEIDLNDEPSLGNVLKKKKVPKRILHFSDGIMEEYDSDDSDDSDVKVEEPFRKGKVRELEATPAVDPKVLTWPQWVKHYTVRGGSKALNVMDRVGENVAYYLGITTPKYQYEIDEYYRAKEGHLAKKKLEDIEFQTWDTSPNPASAPGDETGQVITEEQKPMHPSIDHQLNV